MDKEETICKNCKYHYIEEISFDYPQSCCGKRKAVIEEWFKCNDFEYSDRYIKQLQQENKQLKDNWDKLKEDLITNVKYWEEQEKEWINLGFIKLGGEANNKIIFKKVLDKMKELEEK